MSINSIPNHKEPTVATMRIAGGVDLVSSAINANPGTMMDCRNMEIDVDGTPKWIQGYERVDGRPAPSAATYTVIALTITGTIAVGDTVTGNTSGATGKVIVKDTTTTTNDFLIVTKVTGTFTDTEVIKVAGIAQGTAVPDTLAWLTNLLDVTYINAAADNYRADITTVTGEGSILGGFSIGSTKYAWRNNIGSTAAELYKSTSSGWTLVALGRELSYTSGGLAAATGSVTLTGGGAGSVNSVTVNSVTITSGAVPFNATLTQTATDLAANINAYTSSPEYTAVAVGTTVTITAVTTGTGPNGFVVATTLTTITTSTVNMANGAAGVAIAEGDVITGATSGATATVTRITLESGTWAGGDAAGRLIFASQTGVFVAERLTVAGVVNKATIAGNSSAITMSPNGRFKTYTYNFGGTSFTRRVYGCDGVNRGWEFSGTVFVPINTGMSTSTYGDRPSNVIAHKNHLFFSFGPSVQYSGVGYPYAFDPSFGSDEIMAGEDVTGFNVEMGSDAVAALVIFSRNTTNILYGNDIGDFVLIKFRDEVGAYENSIQSMGTGLFIDDAGFQRFRATQEFGNFSAAALSAPIRPWLNTRKSTIKDSCIVRGKNQYRAFFNDKSAFYATFVGNKLLGFTTVYLDHKVTCMWSVEESDGSDGIYFGSDNGYVYQLDKGTSFDGGEIQYLAMLHYNSFRSPRLNKTWKTASLEVSGEGYAEFSLGYELGYSTADIAQPTASISDYLASDEDFSSSRWDEITWDDFYWDGRVVSPQNFKLVGTSENIALIFYGQSDLFRPLRFPGATLRYSPRRYLR